MGEAHRVKSPHAAQQTYRRLGFARDLEVLVLNCDDPHLRHFGVTELGCVERKGDRGCGVEGRGSSGSSLSRAGECAAGEEMALKCRLSTNTPTSTPTRAPNADAENTVAKGAQVGHGACATTGIIAVEATTHRRAGADVGAMTRE